MSPRGRGGGRRQSSERIRELIAILSSLSQLGTRVSIATLAERLGVDHDEATQLMNIVCQASGESGGGLLISADDGMTEFTLEYAAVRGRAIRLTRAETMALVHALDRAGIPSDDPLRNRIRSSFSNLEVHDNEVRRRLGTPGNSSVQEALGLCARAKAESRMLMFAYQGMADKHPLERTILVRQIRLEDEGWYVDAYDLDRLEDRIFRIDRMQSITLGPNGILPDEDESTPKPPRRVSFTLNNTHYLTLFDWPGIRITKSNAGSIEGSIPYYGEYSCWLLRRIIACGGDLIIHDERIMQLAQDYATRVMRARG